MLDHHGHATGSVDGAPFAHAGFRVDTLPKALHFHLVQKRLHGGCRIEDRLPQLRQGAIGQFRGAVRRDDVALRGDRPDQAVERVDLVHGDAEDEAPACLVALFLDILRRSFGRVVIGTTKTRQRRTVDKPRAAAPDQPGDRYFDQALEAIRNSTTLPRGAYDQDQQERLAGNLAKAALSHMPPLRAIDHAVLSKPNPETGKPDLVFAVQGGLHDPAHLRTHVPLDAALATPLEETRQQVNQLALTRQQEQQQEQQQELQQQQVQQQRGPALS